MPSIIHMNLSEKGGVRVEKLNDTEDYSDVSKQDLIEYNCKYISES